MAVMPSLMQTHSLALASPTMADYNHNASAPYPLTKPTETFAKHQIEAQLKRMVSHNIQIILKYFQLLEKSVIRKCVKDGKQRFQTDEKHHHDQHN